jgi:hypothetical protein
MRFPSSFNARRPVEADRNESGALNLRGLSPAFGYHYSANWAICTGGTLTR